MDGGADNRSDDTTTIAGASVTTLRDSTVNLIALRARSQLERDLWVWAINAETGTHRT